MLTVGQTDTQDKNRNLLGGDNYGIIWESNIVTERN